MASKEASFKANQKFVREVEQALNKFNQPDWLGQFSPLASTYLLGHHLQGEPAVIAAPHTRGNTLQQLIGQIIDTIPEHNQRWGSLWHKLLKHRYLASRQKTVPQMTELLNMAEATYHRHRKSAVTCLAKKLIRYLTPALQLESPPPSKQVLGYDLSKTQALTFLEEGKGVGLQGAGGIGKTTLGGWLAHQFAPQATFWYTFRPGLNDQLQTLLFHLAYFLYTHQISNLWQVLVTDQPETDKVLDLLRHDLAQLPVRTIFCFDEVDLLRPDDVTYHQPIIPFLESLQGQVPLILMGQKQLIPTDHTIVLTGLPRPVIADLLSRSNIVLDETSLARLHRDTQGNPRLLTLFIALYQSLQRANQPVDDALDRLATDPSLASLLIRIGPHLEEAERRLLKSLSVFQNPAPAEVWSSVEEQAAVAQLAEWYLIQVKESAQLSLLPAFKRAIYEQLLTPDERRSLHWEAAEVRSQYNQYTAAAYHYYAAGEAETAVRVWGMYSEQEINQGQAQAALSLFQSIAEDELSDKVKDELASHRSKLLALLGDYDQARDVLRQTAWTDPFAQVQARRLEGDIAELRGEIPQALQAYEEGVETVTKWMSEAASFHHHRGYLYLHQRDFTAARREVFRIRHEAANLEGVILERQGDIEAAQRAYLDAIVLARQADYAYGEANVRNNLGRLLAWHREMAESERHLQQAIDYFSRTNRLNKLASATVNLAFAYRLADHYEAAITPATEALAMFERLGETFGQAVAAQTLAEVYLALNDLERAEQFTRRVLHQEEPNTLPDAWRTLGEIRLRQNNPAEAESLVTQSLQLAEDQQDKVLAAYAWRALGEIHIARQQVDEAKACLETARRIFAESKMPSEVNKTDAILKRI